jgi:hypothetical protein
MSRVTVPSSCVDRDPEANLAGDKGRSGFGTGRQLFATSNGDGILDEKYYLIASQVYRHIRSVKCLELALCKESDLRNADCGLGDGILPISEEPARRNCGTAIKKNH